MKKKSGYSNAIDAIIIFLFNVKFNISKHGNNSFMASLH